VIPDVVSSHERLRGYPDPIRDAPVIFRRYVSTGRRSSLPIEPTFAGGAACAPAAINPAERRVVGSRWQKGANRLIILPTGYACATHAPPVGAVANALHALTLLIARQLVSELEGLDPGIEYFVVPPLCPLVGSPYDFSRTSDHIERAVLSTDAWLAQNGLEQRGIPDEMRPHNH
jgi:hypothetical protein